MLTSVLEAGVSVGAYPDLAGKRVLITGLDLGAGVDLARAFAEQGCRIALHTTGAGAETDAVLEMLSRSAAELQVYSEPLTDVESTVRFAQAAARAFGGLDAVVNLVRIDAGLVAADAAAPDIEGALARQMQNGCLLTRIAANRMRLTWSEGLILNVMMFAPPRSRSEAALLSIARAMLASMTRTEATQWADQAIRINAVAPSLEPQQAAPSLESEPDIAALALFLASPRGRELSGLVFETALAGSVQAPTP
ncbi:MAG: SDR family oxidoreductase [Hyphomicrobiaceae bacterium]|nr:SDR family oxidoreductase [Hyphomicrobiaceae bacterium]